MYLEEIILFWIIVLDWIISFKFSIKGAPTKSSLLGLLPVRDGDHCYSLTASTASGLSLLLCSTSWKNNVTCDHSNQLSACTLIPSV